MTFHKSGGSESIVCGDTGSGNPIPELNATYLIGIDGHFSMYLDRATFKIMPESAAGPFL